MDPEAHRDLKLLDAIASDSRVTQRSLATKLGIALGLTNLYLKRLARKGYIKLVNIQPNRIRYLITPQGIAEKTRLTYEFMEYSLLLYRQARQHLRTVLLPLTAAGHKRIAIYGTGEAAELAYLSLRELGLEPAAIFDGTGTGEFLGMPVQDIRAQDMISYDLIIVATMDTPDRLIAELVQLGVPPEKLAPLRR